jgi:hypothetical protein
LEDEADRLLKESLVGVTSFEEKRDILTPWKEADRRRREILVPSGTPDSALRRGVFGRAYNAARPELNATNGRRRQAPNSRDGFSGSLGDFVEGLFDE